MFTACNQDNSETNTSTAEKTVVSSAVEESSEISEVSEELSSAAESAEESKEQSDTSSESSAEDSAKTESKESSKENSKEASKTSTVQSSVQSSSASAVKPNISFQMPDSNDNSSTASVAEASGSTQNPAQNSGTSANDPHKAAKEKISGWIRNFLSEPDYRDNGGLIFFVDSNLSNNIEAEGLGFEIEDRGNVGISGVFSDGAKWSFNYTEIYRDDAFKNYAKRSSLAEDNKYLDTILDIFRKALAGHNKNEYLSNDVIMDASERVLENVGYDYDKTLSLQTDYDGIRGLFNDGSEWGYTYEELMS